MTSSIRITKEDLTGVLAIMPTPAIATAGDPAILDTVDHPETVRAVEALIGDKVNAILTNGTFGEGATLTWEESKGFASTVIKAAGGRVPVFVGATTLNTRDTIARARSFRDLGAHGLLLGRPMWSYCDDTETVQFYRSVAEAVPELAIIVYDNPEAFKGKISSEVYAELADIPQVIAAKYPSLAAGFAVDLEAVGGKVRLLPVDRDWYDAWRMAPTEVLACWSGSASCGPQAHVALAQRIHANDAEGAHGISTELQEASRGFFPQGDFALFSRYNIQLEKIRINEAGYIKAGPSRPPYTHCPDEYAEGARKSGRQFALLNANYAASASSA